LCSEEGWLIPLLMFVKHKALPVLSAAEAAAGSSLDADAARDTNAAYGTASRPAATDVCPCGLLILWSCLYLYAFKFCIDCGSSLFVTILR